MYKFIQALHNSYTYYMLGFGSILAVMKYDDYRMELLCKEFKAKYSSIGVLVPNTTMKDPLRVVGMQDSGETTCIIVENKPL